MWEYMHNEMAGYYEVRTRARKQLYRLFCVLEHRQPGLPANCIKKFGSTGIIVNCPIVFRAR